MARHAAAAATDALAVLRTVLLAALLLCLAAVTPVEAAELGTGGSSNGAVSSSGGPVWDDPDPPDRPPYSHRHGQRSHHRPADHPLPTGSRILYTLDHGVGSAAARLLPRPTAHGPPRERLPGSRPAARPAVLQVFRL